MTVPHAIWIYPGFIKGIRPIRHDATIFDLAYVAVHNAAKQLMPAEAFVISLLDEATGEIEVVYLVDGDKRAPISRLPRDQGLSGRVISTGEPLLLHGAEAAENMGAVRYARNSTPLSILAVPIMLSGRTIGMLSVQSYQPTPKSSLASDNSLPRRSDQIEVLQLFLITMKAISEAVHLRF